MVYLELEVKMVVYKMCAFMDIHRVVLAQARMIMRDCELEVIWMTLHCDMKNIDASYFCSP